MTKSADSCGFVAKVIRTIKEPEFKPNINKDTLIQLVRLSVEFMSFEMTSTFYQQAHVCFIGSPLSPCLAEISIHHCGEIIFL